jgi:putative ABC transport system permease protein
MVVQVSARVAPMLKLALRNVIRQRGRTALTLAAIAFGVAGLILAGGFVQDVYVQLAEATIRSQLGHIQIYRKGFYAAGARKPQEYVLMRPDQIVREGRSNPAVRDVMLRLNFSGLLNNGRADLAVIGEGMQPDKEARLGSFITILEGKPLSDEDRFGIVVGEGVAKALKLAPGAHVTLVTNTIDGVLNSLDFVVVGVFRSFSKDYDNRAVRVPLAAARDLLATNAANTAVVLLYSTEDTDQVKGELERALASQSVEIMTWLELSDFYRKTIELYRRQFGFLQVITLLMVVLSVANSVSMTTFERVGEFGTMRAMGDRSRKIFWLVVLEKRHRGPDRRHRRRHRRLGHRELDFAGRHPDAAATQFGKRVHGLRADRAVDRPGELCGGARCDDHGRDLAGTAHRPRPAR